MQFPRYFLRIAVDDDATPLSRSAAISTPIYHRRAAAPAAGPADVDTMLAAPRRHIEGARNASIVDDAVHDTKRMLDVRHSRISAPSCNEV